MLKRKMFWGFYEEKNISVDENVYSNLVYFEDKVFIYIEADESYDFKELVCGDFKVLPNGEYLMEMSRIFAYSPIEDDWERTEKKTAVFSIARLNRDMAYSYIYYHYKLQNEGCGSYDKYGSIFFYDNILIMYLETPRQEGRSWKRTIPENNIPYYEGDIIKDHSIPWEDGTLGWKRI